MANRNEPNYLERFLKEFPVSGWTQHLDAGRVLNVGSADYGMKKFFDAILQGKPVLGVDIKEHEGVDLICDMEGDCKELNDERFAMVLCCSVLEHTKRPWLVAANIEKHMMPQGLLYVTVPWVWRTHNYPSDYWRMSIEGVKTLFPNIIWKRLAHSTQNENEFLNYGVDHDDGRPWRELMRGRAYIVVQQIHMIGRLA